MQVNPYLTFNGQCEQALKFYEQVLGAKLEGMTTWSEMPGADKFPSEMLKLIMHARFSVGNSVLMAADAPPEHYKQPGGMNVSIHVKDAAEGERIFNALAENGKVTMPFEKTFWSPGFGMCVDQFGIPWMVNTEGHD